MRTAYKRERKKVESSKSTGAGTSEVHTPTLWYYQYLTFLDGKLDSSTEAIDNLNNENKDEPAKKKKRDSSTLRENNLLKRQEELIESAQRVLSSGEENSADAFGRSMSSQLKELPKLQRCLAEKLMSEIIFYAKLDLLNVKTAINLKYDRHPRESFNSHSYYARPSSSSPLHPIPSPRHPPPSRHHSIPSSPYPSPSPHHPSLSPHHSILSPSPSPSPHHPSPSPHHPSPSPHHLILSPCHQSPSPHHSISLSRYSSPSPHHSIPSPHHPLPSPHHSIPSPRHPLPSSHHSNDSVPSTQSQDTSPQVHSSSYNSSMQSEVPFLSINPMYMRPKIPP